MKVPFGTITITDKAKELVSAALDSGRVSSGKYVREFEKRFAELVGTKEAVALSSGTDADTLALAVLYDYGAKRGDEVIIPALSFVATGNAVLHAGFSPVFVDVEYDTFNIDPEKIEAAITDRTRAIMPVHLMGKPAEMDRIKSIAGKAGLTVIEDAAEAHGAEYKGKNIGTLGDMAAYSLYVAHIISTVEGGIVTTDNEDYAEILRSLRSHGRFCKCNECVMGSGAVTCGKRFRGGVDYRFFFERVGYSSKMNELEAAVGLGYIDIYHDVLKKRHDNLISLIEGFREFAPYLNTFKEEENERIGPHAFPIIVGNKAGFSRDDYVEYLKKNKVDSRNMFMSIPMCPGFRYLGYKEGQFPTAEYISENGLHVGVHQDMGMPECEYIIETTREFIRLNT